MLKLIQIEFLKLHRKKLVWILLLVALIMPFFTHLYVDYMNKANVTPMQFYKWCAFSYTLLIILPAILGILCVMLMYDENQYDMLKQLRIVPISKMGYFFSKFFVVLIFSICFMLITVVASVAFGVIPGHIAFDWGSVLLLLKRCIEAGVITAFAMMPILAIAASQKGYILPACITLIYIFLGMFLVTINLYIHPLSSMLVIIMRNKDIPDIAFNQAINLPFAFLCICIWDIISILFVNIMLSRRE